MVYKKLKLVIIFFIFIFIFYSTAYASIMSSIDLSKWNDNSTVASWEDIPNNVRAGFYKVINKLRKTASYEKEGIGYIKKRIVVTNYIFNIEIDLCRQVIYILNVQKI